jgi:hypothetical protein
LSPSTGATFGSTLLHYSVAGYAIAVLVSLYVLWTFGRTEGVSLFDGAKMVAVLGFPAAIGAALARLLVYVEMASRSKSKEQKKQAAGKPVLEWVASMSGLTILATLAAILSWDGLQKTKAMPAVAIEKGRIMESRHSYT